MNKWWRAWEQLPPLGGWRKGLFPLPWLDALHFQASHDTYCLMIVAAVALYLSSVLHGKDLVPFWLNAATARQILVEMSPDSSINVDNWEQNQFHILIFTSPFEVVRVAFHRTLYPFQFEAFSSYFLKSHFVVFKPSILISSVFGCHSILVRRMSWSLLSTLDLSLLSPRLVFFFFFPHDIPFPSSWLAIEPWFMKTV